MRGVRHTFPSHQTCAVGDFEGPRGPRAQSLGVSDATLALPPTMRDWSGPWPVSTGSSSAGVAVGGACSSTQPQGRCRGQPSQAARAEASQDSGGCSGIALLPFQNCVVSSRLLGFSGETWWRGEQSSLSFFPNLF